MIESASSAGIANAERFERFGVAADAEGAARTRTEFARWLATFFGLDATLSSDVVLAINEALANAAEYAYLTAGRPGTMDIEARFEVDNGKLSVLISDNGRWHIPDAHPADPARGRGIPLMRALSDHSSIESSSHGTTVCLEWTGIARA